MDWILANFLSGTTVQRKVVSKNPYVIFEVGVMKSLLTLPNKDRHMIKKWPTPLRN